jgi:hypothetical protein
MQANIYIHIGLHKTGSSSIQNTFFSNRDKLLSHGINYLSLSLNHSGVLYSLYCVAPHQTRANRAAGIDTKEKAAKKNAATRAALRQALESNSSASIVISGEGLSRLPAEGLERLRLEFTPYAARFRIIVYVRDPYSTVNSMAQQRIRRRGQTYEQIIAAPPYPRYSRIAQAIQVFGRENVDIRLFDAAHFVNGDLIADFLSAIDASPDLRRELEVERTNVALSHEAAYLLHEINKYRPPARDRRPHDDVFQLFAAIPGQPYRCPPEIFVAVQPFVAKQLQWLRDLLGKDVFSDRPAVPDAASYWNEKTLTAVALLLDDLAHKDREKRGFLPRISAMMRRLTSPAPR